MKQVSVFLENKPGTLNFVLDLMASSSIQLMAICLADVAEYGLCRFLCDDPDKAVDILRDSGLAASLSDVLALAMDKDTPGQAAAIVNMMSSNGLNLSYLYSFSTKEAGDTLAIKTDDMAKARAVAEKSSFKIIEL